MRCSPLLANPAVALMVLCALVATARAASNFHKYSVIQHKQWWALPSLSSESPFTDDFEGYWVRLVLGGSPDWRLFVHTYLRVIIHMYSLTMHFAVATVLRRRRERDGCAARARSVARGAARLARDTLGGG